MNSGKLIFIVASGTVGDVVPFIRLGKTLKSLGFSIVLLSNDNHKHQAEAAGLQFISIATAMPEQKTETLLESFKSIVVNSFRKSASIIQLAAESERSCGVVAHDLALGAISICEKLQIPFARVILSPLGILACNTNQSGGVAAESNVDELNLVNSFRADFQMSSLSSLNGLGISTATANIAMFPRAFACVERIGIPGLTFAGFPFGENSRDKIDFDLKLFFDHHDQPIIATAGTGAPRAEAEAFFRPIAELCESTATPAVFLCLRNDLETFESPLIKVRDFIDLANLLPISRLIIHHGGVGVTAEALRAGIPQIVRPRLFDQPYNASIAEDLGVALTISPAAFERESLLRAMKLLQGPKTDRNVASAAAWARKSDGIATAASIINDEIGILLNASKNDIFKV